MFATIMTKNGPHSSSPMASSSTSTPSITWPRLVHVVVPALIHSRSPCSPSSQQPRSPQSITMPCSRAQTRSSGSSCPSPRSVFSRSLLSKCLPICSILSSHALSPSNSIAQNPHWLLLGAFLFSIQHLCLTSSSPPSNSSFAFFDGAWFARAHGLCILR